MINNPDGQTFHQLDGFITAELQNQKKSKMNEDYRAKISTFFELSLCTDLDGISHS